MNTIFRVPSVYYVAVFCLGAGLLIGSRESCQRFITGYIEPETSGVAQISTEVLKADALIGQNISEYAYRLVYSGEYENSRYYLSGSADTRIDTIYEENFYKPSNLVAVICYEGRVGIVACVGVEHMESVNTPLQQLLKTVESLTKSYSARILVSSVSTRRPVPSGWPFNTYAALETKLLAGGKGKMGLAITSDGRLWADPVYASDEEDLVKKTKFLLDRLCLDSKINEKQFIKLQEQITDIWRLRDK